MPYVKPISGHTSCRFVQEYLEKDNRALARDFLELEESDSRSNMSWSAQMDKTREVYGNNRSINGHKTRTYNHYILSPDPKDEIELEDLRAYATEWASKSFPGFQVAIVYHDDSSERLKNGEKGILHAHLIVNNTNLDTGKRLAPWLTASRVRTISRLAQDMAKERGWGAFEWEEMQEETKSLKGFSVEEKVKRKKTRGRGVTRQGDYYTRSELGVLKDRGWSWKEDLRARIRIAKALSCTEREFIEALEELGVKLSRSRTGDYLYTYKGHESWCATGKTLGKQYMREVVLERMQEEELRRSKEKEQKGASSERRDIALAALEYFAIDSIRTIGWLGADGLTTLRDVAEMLETNRTFNVVRMSDYKDALEGIEHGSSDYMKVERAMMVAERIGLRDEPLEDYHKRQVRATPQRIRHERKTLAPSAKKKNHYRAQATQRKTEPKGRGQGKDRRQR